MAKIKTLKNNNGETFYPQTHTKAVVDSNGNSVDTLLNKEQGSINHLKANAAQYNSLSVATLEDSVEILVDKVHEEGVPAEAHIITIPAATTENAGVMSAEDKEKLDTSIVILKGFATVWYALSSWTSGESYYDIDDKVIKTSGEVSNGTVVNWASESQPTLNTIYVCGSTIYVWNGNDLIAVANTEDLGKIAYKTEQVYIVQGTINAGGGEESSDTRIRTTTKFKSVNGKITFFITNADYKFRVFKYDDNGSFINYSEYTDSTTQTINDSQYFKVVFLRNDDSVISVNDFNDIGFHYNNAVLDTYKIADDLTALINKESSSCLQGTVEVEPGTLNAGGGEDYMRTRIRTATRFKSVNGAISFSISNTNYKYRVFLYNNDNSFVNYIEYAKPSTHNIKDSQYLRVVFLRVDDAEISVDAFNEIGFQYDNAVIDTYAFSDEVEDVLDKYIFKNTAYSTCNLNGKNVAFIGDSITASGSPSTQDNMYHAVFSRLTGCNVKNLGSWNTTIARDVDNLTDTAQPFITRVTEENLADCDMVVVFGGINDFAHDNNPIGEAFTETETDGIKQLVPNSDTRCFSGAMHELIQGIRSIVPLAPIVFITPLMGYRSNDIRINSIANAHGDYLEDFRKTINEICSFYMVPVFNIDKVFNYDPNNTEQRAAFFADGLHPNDAGHIHIGKLLYQFVMQNVVV